MGGLVGGDGECGSGRCEGSSDVIGCAMSLSDCQAVRRGDGEAGGRRKGGVGGGSQVKKLTCEQASSPPVLVDSHVAAVTICGGGIWHLQHQRHHATSATNDIEHHLNIGYAATSAAAAGVFFNPVCQSYALRARDREMDGGGRS